MIYYDYYNEENEEVGLTYRGLIHDVQHINEDISDLAMRVQELYDVQKRQNTEISRLMNKLDVLIECIEQ